MIELYFSSSSRDNSSLSSSNRSNKKSCISIGTIFTFREQCDVICCTLPLRSYSRGELKLLQLKKRPKLLTICPEAPQLRYQYNTRRKAQKVEHLTKEKRRKVHPSGSAHHPDVSKRTASTLAHHAPATPNVPYCRYCSSGVCKMCIVVSNHEF